MESKWLNYINYSTNLPKNNNKEYYEVQWKGYRETTLEPRDVFLEDVPKMVNQFEKKNKIAFYDSKNKKTNKITRRIYKDDEL